MEKASEKMQLTRSYLKQLPAMKLGDDPGVFSQMVEVYNRVHGTDIGKLVAHKEVLNFRKIVADNPALRECEGDSLYGCLIDVMINGLSLESHGKPDCYLQPRSFNVGTKDKAEYVKRAMLTISPYGELKMRMNAGHIKYAGNPVVVYEGDTFIVREEKGVTTVTYEKKIPRKSNKIIASYVKLTRADGRIEYFVMEQQDIERLRKYSEKNNKGKANNLYSSDGGQVDKGFLEAKTLKHAFRSFPKVRTTQNSELEQETPATMDITHEEIYGLKDEPESGPQDEFTEAIEEASAAGSGESVTVQTSNDEDELFG